MAPLTAAGFSAFCASALAFWLGARASVLLGALFLFAFFCVLFTADNRVPHRRILLFALAAAAAATGRCAWVTHSVLEPVQRMEGTVWAVEGQITDILPQDGGVRYTVRAELPESGLEHPVKLYLWASSDLAAASPGDTVSGTAYFYEYSTDSRLERAARVSNGVYLHGTLKECEFEESRVLLPETVFSILRQRLSRTIAYAIPDQHGALVCALLCGDRSRLDAGLERDIRTAGLSHILAISGFHLSVVASILRLLVGKLRPSVRSAVCISGIIGYALLTGASYSVIRAGMMWTLLLIAEAVFRRYDSVNALGAAVLVMVLFQPLVSVSLSMWYSCQATLAILVLTRPAAHFFSEKLRLSAQEKEKAVPGKIRGRAARILLDSCCASLCACVAVLPISWAVGNTISLLSPVSTVAAGIFLLPLMLGGLLTGLVSWMPFRFGILAKLTGLLSGAFAGLISMLAGIPFAALPRKIEWIPIWMLGLFLTAIVCIYFRKEKGMLLSGVVWSLFSLLLSFLGYRAMTFDLTRVVIPSGTECVIVSRENAHFLVGSLHSEYEGELAAKTLQDYGIRHLELAVLGEWNGAALEALCREAKMETLYTSGFAGQAMLRYADSAFSLEPAEISVDDGLSIEIMESGGGYVFSVSLDEVGMLIFSPEYDIMDLDIYPFHDLVLLPGARAEGIDHLPAAYNIVTANTDEYNRYHAPRAAEMVDAQHQDAVFYIRDGGVKLISWP